MRSPSTGRSISARCRRRPAPSSPPPSAADARPHATGRQVPIRPFYDTVLGLTSETVPFGPGFSYTMFVVDGQQVGGNTPPQTEGVPNHWNVWFATADAYATAARAVEREGAVL